MFPAGLETRRRRGNGRGPPDQPPERPHVLRKKFLIVPFAVLLLFVLCPLSARPENVYNLVHLEFLEQP
jgi:hypothetical protein